MPARKKPAAPVEQTEPDGGTAGTETVATEPEAEVEAPVDKARKLTAAQLKKVADEERHDAAVEAGAPPEATEEMRAADEAKAALYKELDAEQQKITDLEILIRESREKSKEILDKIHPQFQASDRHVDAVRQYVKSQHKIRQNRALEPARLKAILEQAGKAPIDAAFQRARARGAGRPSRRPMTGEAPGAADAGKE